MTKQWTPNECAEDPVRASNLIDDLRGMLKDEAVEIVRLKNITQGCPVCSELERNIQPAHNS